MKLQYIIHKHTSHVQLRKDQRYTLGISVTDSHKDKCRPVIKSIKNGSLAQKSHSLAEGDVILSVRGHDSRGMRKADVKRLFKESDPVLDIKVEYLTRDAGFDYCRIYRSQRMFLTLRKERGSFGFVLRKNDLKRAGVIEYPIVSNIKSGGPADKEGSMMAGDRLLEVDNQSLSWLSLTEVATLLQEKDEAVFLIEYSVGIVELSREKPIQLEIDCPDTKLGMRLAASDSSKMFISSIQQGSLAQRCGAFHVGDEILAINGVDVSSLTASKANDILHRFKKSSLKLTFKHNGGESIQLSDKGDTSNPPATTYQSKGGKDSPFAAQSEIACVPPNSPATSYHSLVGENAFFQHAESDKAYNNCQLKTMSALRDINRSVINLLSLLEGRTNPPLDTISFDDTPLPPDRGINSIKGSSERNSVKMSHLIARCLSIKNLTRDLTAHIIINTSQMKACQEESSPSRTFQDDISDSSSDSGSFISELVDNLNEIAAQRFMSKNSVEKFTLSISLVDRNCTECITKCYTASFAAQKVLLLLSLSNPTPQEATVIRQVMHTLSKLGIPCEECSKSWSSVYNSREFQLNQSPQATSKYTRLPRPWGVGASSSSGTSKQSTVKDSPYRQNCKLKQEPQVGLNMLQQTAMYRLTEIQSEETDDDLYIKRGSVETWDCPQEIYNSCISTRDSPTLPGSPQVVVNGINDKLVTKQQSSANCYADKANNKSGLAFFNRTRKSSEVASKTEDELAKPSVRPKSSIPQSSVFQPRTPTQNFTHYNRNRNSFNFDFSNEECLLTAGPSYCADQNIPSKDHTNKIRMETHPEIHDIVLKADSRGCFGLVLGYSSLSLDENNRIPIITSIKPKSAAYKNGLLKKGDRILAMNGFSTLGVSVHELEAVKREIFTFTEIVLRIEFDVRDVDVKWGTFTLQLEDTVKLGLVMDEPRNPTFVKGMIKGSAAHRCGQIFPEDELLSFKSFREDHLNLETWEMRRNKTYKLVIRRHPDRQPLGQCRKMSPDIPLDPVSLLRSGCHFNIKRTSVRTMEGLEGRDRIVLEHEFTLFRDPLTWDFGFLFGENPRTGKAYVTDVRPGGPADNSKVIKKKDRIMEVNGILVDGRTENSIMNLLIQTDDCVNLLTRRVLNYR